MRSRFTFTLCSLAWALSLSAAGGTGLTPWELNCQQSLQYFAMGMREAGARSDSDLHRRCFSNHVACEFRFSHGPKISELVAEGYAFDSQAAEDVTYLRSPLQLTQIRKENPRFLLNSKAAHKNFKLWFEMWLGNASVNFESWKISLRARHLIATGALGDCPHRGPGDEYSSNCLTWVNPGRFRSEDSFLSTPFSHTSVSSANHVRAWLAYHGHDFDIGNRAVQVNGLELLRRETGRDISSSTTVRLLSGATFFPHDVDVDAYLLLGWNRLTELKVALEVYRRSQPAQKAHAREQALVIIADYFQTAVIGHYFRKVNTSMLMPEVNTFLEYLDLTPVQHGELDLAAMRMDYLPFREYFRYFLGVYSGLR